MQTIKNISIHNFKTKNSSSLIVDYIDDLFFYIYDQYQISIYFKHEHLSTISDTRLSPLSKDSQIKFVTHRYIFGQLCLVICTTAKSDSSCKVLIYDVLKDQISALPFSFPDLSNIILSKTVKVEKNSKEFQYMVFTSDNNTSRIFYRKIFKSAKKPYFQVENDQNCFIEIEKETITSINTFKAENSNDIYIIAGLSNGRIHLYQLNNELHTLLKINMPSDLPKSAVTKIDVFEASLDIFIVLNYDNNYDDKRAEVAPSYHFLIFNSSSVSLSYLKGIEPKLQYTEGRLLNCALLQDIDDSIYFINGFQSTENVEQCDVMLLINKYKEGKLETVSSQETSFSGNFHPQCISPLFENQMDCCLISSSRIEYLNNLTNAEESSVLELPSPITHTEITKIFGKITDLQIANIYSPQVAHSIKSKRSNNCVFLMDKMMESTELDPAEHYPPTSASSLLDLVEKIINSTAETQVSLGIIYYIVTDCKDLISLQTYLELVPLSQRYRTLIDGYWLLDHDYYEKAYKCLISPTLELNWVDLILNNFVHAQELSLGVKLYNHLQPKFNNIDFLRTIVQLFTPSSFPQAYTEIKSRNPTKSQTEELLKYIIYLAIQSSSASQSFTKISFENRDLKFVLRYLSEENGIEFKMLYLLISLKYFKFRQFLNYFENYGNLIESHNDRYYKSFKHIANNLNSSVTI